MAIHGEDAEAWGKQVTEYINTQIRNGKDVTVYTENGVPLTITKDTARKAAYWNRDAYGRPVSTEDYALIERENLAGRILDGDAESADAGNLFAGRH